MEFWFTGYQDEIIWLGHFIVIAKNTIVI